MDNKTYTIRPVEPNDAESYNAFIRRLADEPNNGVTFHPSEFTVTVAEARERIESMLALDNCMIFVAVNADNIVVGECSGSASQRLAKQHNVGLGLSVDQDWRRLGVGRSLMNAIIAWAEANPMVHRLELEVFTDNIKAINLYIQLGFIVEGTRRNAFVKYGNFKDAYMMSMLFNRDDNDS